MRAEVIKTRQATFVEVVVPARRLALAHPVTARALPNASRSALPLAVLQFGLSILVIASLAFLGYGDPPPASDWGLLISIGKDYLKWPWLVRAPAFVAIATVLSVNRISRWLRKTRLTDTLTRAESASHRSRCRSIPLLGVDGLSVSYGPHEVVTDVGVRTGPRREPRAHPGGPARASRPSPARVAAASLPSGWAAPPAGSSSTAGKC